MASKAFHDEASTDKPDMRSEMDELMSSIGYFDTASFVDVADAYVFKTKFRLLNMRHRTIREPRLRTTRGCHIRNCINKYMDKCTNPNFAPHRHHRLCRRHMVMYVPPMRCPIATCPNPIGSNKKNLCNAHAKDMGRFLAAKRQAVDEAR